VAALAAAALLSACGSTVQVRGDALVGDLGGELQATTGQQLGGKTGAPQAGTTGATRPGSTGSTTGGSTTRLPTVRAPAPITTQPATKAPVEIGIVIFPDVNQAAQALGGSAEVGDQRSETELALTWVNDHGGLAGHKVVPVYFEVSLTSTQPYAVTYEQICTSFTQDHHVIAVIAIANVEDGLPNCLAKTRTLFFTHGHYLHSEPDYARLTNMITPEDAGSDRIARSLVQEILSSGAVKRGDKLGLLVFDYSATQRAKDAIIVPAMKAKGIEVISYTIPWPQSTPDIANSASVVQSAELQMAAQGVKTVTFVCPGCFTFFVRYAESQAYYPRYVLTSLDGLFALKGKGHGRALANALAVGWDPIKDVSTYADPSPLAGNPMYALCRKIEKTNISNDASLFASLALCGAMQSLYAAASANPVAAVTGQSLMAGYDALGSSFAGPANLSTLLKPGHRDGTTGYRMMRYVSGCDCFVYDKGPLRTLA
jgi:hypothetical protein